MFSLENNNILIDISKSAQIHFDLEEIISDFKVGLSSKEVAHSYCSLTGAEQAFYPNHKQI
jgi:hypothetical protein